MPLAATPIHPADWAVVALYFAATMGIGFYFYRKSGAISAYELLERRFGPWARLFTSAFYLLFHVAPADLELNDMGALYAGTVLWGVLGTGLALFLVQVTASALDMWWVLSGIIGGGMTGLFLLGIINKRAGNPAAIAGVIAGVLTISWIRGQRSRGSSAARSRPFSTHKRLPSSA